MLGNSNRLADVRLFVGAIFATLYAAARQETVAKRQLIRAEHVKTADSLYFLRYQGYLDQHHRKWCDTGWSRPEGISYDANIYNNLDEVIDVHGEVEPWLTPETAMKRWPRLTAHLISHSLGYMTPTAAANALAMHKRGEPNFCEWYTHMAQGFDRNKVLEIGRRAIDLSYRNRHSHAGYMSNYRLARGLVDQAIKNGDRTILSSW